MDIREAIAADAPGLARVQVDSYQTAYAGILSQDYLDQFSYAEQEQDWRELIGDAEWEDILLVALDDAGTVVAYALGRPGPTDLASYDGELVALHVRLDRQRQGIGRALVAALLDRMGAADCTAVMLWVLAENHKARAFYEALNARWLDVEKTSGAGALEVAYGWPSLAAARP